MYRSKRRGRGSLLWIAAAVLLSCAALALFFRWEQTALQTEEIAVTDPKLPAAFDGLRIALVSDVHSGQTGADNESILRAVAELKPDLIALTGDLVDCHRPDFSRVEPLARGLSAIAPTYYVTGNHEWALGSAAVRELKRTLADCGVTVLSNEYQVLQRDGETLVLAGIDDPNGFADQKTPEELTEEIRGELGDPFILLLAHRNTGYAVYDRCAVDVTLCGHGHGGLIRLPFTDGLISTDRTLFPDHTSGLYELEQGQMVVSRGLGNSGSTFRLFDRPHLPLVVLHR